MGRRRRRRQQQPQPPPPARSPRLSGAKAGALALFLLGFFETVGPTLCTPRERDMRVASDAGEPAPLPPVPVETWADGAVGGGIVYAVFPAPAPRQHRPPCPAKTLERSGGCWVKAAHDPPCTFFEVFDSGACWIAVPERPKGAPVAGPP